MIEERLSAELEALSLQGQKRELRSIQKQYCGQSIVVDSHKLINLASNDYLGLGSNKELRTQFLKMVSYEDWALGSTSSRLLTGNYPILEELEHSLANRYDRESALVFNSGYHMNVGIISALASHRTLVIADKLVHASMIDGLRLSGCSFERFRHNDITALERILQRKADKYDEVLVLTESIYSMDGDEADLRSLVALKKIYPQLILYVDEAHAVGVRGNQGLGLAEEYGLIQDIDLLCGTFGKALAGMGGYVVCSSNVRSYLINHSRPLIFSTALPPIVSAWNKFIFDRLSDFYSHRSILREKSEKIRNTLKELGYTMPSTSHIIPIILGSNSHALSAASRLIEAGYYSPAVRPPTVPQGSARLRISLTAQTEIEGLLHLLPTLNIAI
ncbi:8-amino-7-oxononanoate synthase [Porphyromonas crevioricanis]|uniref:8-amino-7-oxononanoate synthase n=1 Tax=Porphyromonas crevioricanis TaxID=393921 RepID=A0A2X4PIL2_9PORP|nr:8-amino-7-oxononanoate synthase [Porphyromonas crevioricanis]GAD08348.1 8-amino-7-oxononanoate synthase [Porphyromonas crevioricanis JCM 13913]SQH73794.1 8-amino-7-oxononanoate synthase [Porphyromonas crevioricanis]